MNFIILYTDGFTDLLISFQAIINSKDIQVEGKWFNPYIKEPYCSFTSPSNWPSWLKLAEELKDLKPFYSLNISDLHHVSVEVNLKDHQYIRDFYALGDTLFHRYPFLEDKIQTLTEFIQDTREKIIELARR